MQCSSLRRIASFALPFLAPGAALASLALPLEAQCDALALLDPDPAPSDYQGEAVAVDGDLALVGGSQRFTGVGEVTVYRKENGFWVYEATLEPNDGEAGDEFGWALDVSGDWAVVGAPRHEGGKIYFFRRWIAPAGPDPNAGGPYWVLTFVDDVTQSDAEFGYSVAIDGTDLVVGAPRRDVSSNEAAGRAYVYELFGSTWFARDTIAAPASQAFSEFGFDVAVDNHVILVGHPFNSDLATNGGAAHFYYDAGDGFWFLEDTVYAPAPQASAWFGTSVDLLSVGVPGSYAVIGAPRHNAVFADDGAAYVVERVLNPFPVLPTWEHEATVTADTPETNEHFGTTVAIDRIPGIFVDTTRVHVGATGSDEAGPDAGSVYTFDSQGGWPQTDQLTVPNSQFLGFSLDMDVRRLVTGTWTDDRDFFNQGVGYVFEGSFSQCAPTCTNRRLPDDGFESEESQSAAVAVRGDEALVGVPDDDQVGVDAGAVRAYRRVGGCWEHVETLFASDGSAGDRFGASVALGGNGDLAVIGAPGADSSAPDGGAAYAFRSFLGTWIEEDVLQPSVPTVGGAFGDAVAVDGNRVAVAQPEDPTFGNGRVELFDFVGVWTFHSMLLPDDMPKPGLGRSIALFGDRLAVGDPNDDEAGADAGAVYVFGYDGGSDAWSQRQKILAPDGTSADAFGTSVALSSVALLAGAPGAPRGTKDDAGQVYSFEADGAGDFDLAETLRIAGAKAGGAFGAAVALVGGNAVVGAPGTGSSVERAAHAFERLAGSLAGSWDRGRALAPFGLTDTADFGAAVAVDGTHALIGAPEQNPFGPGTTWIFGLDEVDPPLFLNPFDRLAR